MKKRISIIFFSLCFLAALMAEAYFIRTGDEDLFSVIGIGTVVLITGYLLAYSIRSRIAQSSREAKLFLDQLLREETQKWDERYTRLTNLQKATYSATKKNTAILSEKLEEVLLRLENLENSTKKALQRVSELQKKTMEGQKNALNYEIKYNRENTKQLIKTLREEENKDNIDELLSKLLISIEKNNELLEARTGSNEGMEAKQKADCQTEAGRMPKADKKPVPEAADTNNASKELPGSKAEGANELAITPLYDDPNKNLTTDEIAALFASAGK